METTEHKTKRKYSKLGTDSTALTRLCAEKKINYNDLASALDINIITMKKFLVTPMKLRLSDINTIANKLNVDRTELIATLLS